MREEHRRIYVVIGICLVVLFVISLLYLAVRFSKFGDSMSQSKVSNPTNVPYTAITTTGVPPVTTRYPASPEDVEFIKDYSSKEAELRPDLTVKNTTPLTFEDLYITTEFVDKDQGYFAVVVYSDLESQKTTLMLQRWFDSIGIPPASRSKLKIEYRRRTDPDYM